MLLTAEVLFCLVCTSGSRAVVISFQAKKENKMYFKVLFPSTHDLDLVNLSERIKK